MAPVEYPCPWVKLEEVAHLFGYSKLSSARTAISKGTFPAPTYKVGSFRVIDKDVLNAYFMQHKAAGMIEVKTPKKKLRSIRK
jgi:hypothetical protein